MKKEKGKIKVGGFELFCLIIFAYPLLFIPKLLSMFSTLSLQQVAQYPLAALLFISFMISILLLVYNLYKPMTWIHMKTAARLKLCGIVSLIFVVFSILSNSSLFNLLTRFIFGFVTVFLTFTGANTLALFIQGRATFNTKK